MEIPENFRQVVVTNDGPVRGYIEKDEEKIYYIFKSVPYAKPPLGMLRFMPPVPIQPWTETIECTKLTMPLCIHFNKKILGSEDCLYLDIYTPTISIEKCLPVIFWLGNYYFTYTIDNVLDPSPMVDQDVIFVRCSHRLGAFGFLSIGEFSAAGNNGLKDIVMALKWVQKNIQCFGGDSNNVTLMADSTGGAMVHFMMLSPMAAGLFHKAIIHSSSAFNSWSLAKNPKLAVFELAKVLGINKTEASEVVDELRKLPALEIMEGVHLLQNKILQDDGLLFDSVFKPCIEYEYEGQSSFLTKSPLLIIRSKNFNKVPMIIGSQNIEGSVLQFVKENFYDFEKYNKDVSLLVPRTLVGDTKYSPSIGKKLLDFYFGESIGQKTMNQYLQLVSDYYFLYYINKTVRLHSTYAPDCPLYYFIITHTGEWTVPEHLQFINSQGHGAELPFLFRIKPDETTECKGSRDSIKTRSRIIKMWTNFAKYGNPTPDDEDPLLQITWDPVKSEKRLNYLSIGSELTKGRNPYHDRMAFWEDLYKEHVFLRVLLFFSDLGVIC